MVEQRIVVFTFLVYLAALIMGCGGGGGGDGEPEPSKPSQDACSLLRPKILTGTPCTGSERLPIAEILVRTQTATFLCSGALIAPRFVLTAGHCIFPGNAGRSSAQVFFGSLAFTPVRMTRHPQFQETDDPNIVLNDVGIIELPAAVPIEPIPLDFSVPPEVGDIISIFGYGVDDNGNPGALRSGQMRITQVGSNEIFAVYGNEGSNTCNGDSGGPATLQVNGLAAIVAVTSSGSAENCVIGDNSSFAFVQSPEIKSFIVSLVPDLHQL